MLAAGSLWALRTENGSPRVFSKVSRLEGQEGGLAGHWFSPMRSRIGEHRLRERRLGRAAGSRMCVPRKLAPQPGASI